MARGPHRFRNRSIPFIACRLSGEVGTTCSCRLIRPRVLCWLGAIVLCFAPRASAITPKDVARIVSADRANQRFTDEIRIGKEFETLGIPVLAGSSVLPALTLTEWPVFDEDPMECAPWDVTTAEEFLRLEKLQIGPCREMTDSESSSRSSSVRMVLWPSGHVLWVVKDGKRRVLRNKKGELVEYGFAKIDFDIAIKQIENLISKENRPQGRYRKAVLFDDRHAQGVKYHTLVVVGKEYTFKSVSQIVQKDDDSLWKQKFKFSVERPRHEVSRFMDIRDVVRNMLPPEGRGDTLSSDPAYVWIGKMDLLEAPCEGDKGIRKVEEEDKKIKGAGVSILRIEDAGVGSGEFSLRFRLSPFLFQLIPDFAPEAGGLLHLADPSV